MYASYLFPSDVCSMLTCGKILLILRISVPFDSTDITDGYLKVLKLKMADLNEEC